MITNHQLLTLYQLLNTSQLFEKVDEQHLQHIIQHAHRIRCDNNEYINIKADQENYCYLIEKGNMVLSRVTHDGDSYIVDTITRGSLFGIVNIFKENLEYHMLAKASETSFLWRIPIYILRDLMEKDTMLVRNILRISLKTKVAQDNELEHRTVQNTSQRVSCFLLHHFGRINNSSAVVELPYSKKLIANKLGIRQETFSRALRIINTETGTKVSGSKLFIKDIDWLKSFTCQTCSLDYPCDIHSSKDRIY